MTIELLLAVALLGALVTFVVPDRHAPTVGFLASLPPVAVALHMFYRFDGTGNALTGGDVAYETHYRWLDLSPYAVDWHVGVDGIAMPLILLATILTALAIVSAWTPIDERQSQFYGLVLFMQVGLLGVFAALDFFVFFVFWELVLLPMYFLIAVWGGPRREYAAIKFFVYTNVASLVMFVGFVALVFGLGDEVTSFGMPAIAEALRNGAEPTLAGIDPTTLTAVAFAATFFGFAVKVPVVPVHTWLPDAHVEAPTPVSVLLAGVLLKMGTYALLRFNFTMLPDVAVQYAPVIAAIAVISVLYGAVLALAQRDLKRIVAYSSISSMGYVVLGLLAFTVHGIGGATFQMVSHGLISGLLFMVVGVIYDRTHTRLVDDVSGLADRMPVACGVFVAGAFAYMGLPLMSGFAAEFFVFVGSFGSATLPASQLVTPIAMFGIVIVAGYLLFAMQRTLFGPYACATDYEPGPIPVRDAAPLLTLLGLILLLGVAPELVYGMMRDAAVPIVEGVA